MKFLTRPEWSACFQSVFDAHFGPALDAEDMVFDDIVDILGEHWALTLWGCAFEDFLTQNFAVEGGNFVDEYLKRRGWKESAQTKAYMRALRISVMSLYEVSDILPGESFMARDLLRGGEPITVTEGTATKTLKQWDRIAGRIVPMMGRNVLSGSVLPFTQPAADELIEDLRFVLKKRQADRKRFVRSEDLKAEASMFTVAWLFDTLTRSVAAAAPEMRNSDGDDLLFHDVRFPVASGATDKRIAARLNTITTLEQASPTFWNWLREEQAEDNQAPGTGSSIDSILESGLRVLGNVEIKGRFVKLSANSARRASSGADLIRHALGDLVGPPLTEIRTVEQLMADAPAQDQVETGSDIPPEIYEQVVHRHMDRQYRDTLDQPVGMLDNKTPRQMAKTAKGREKVANWIKYLENQTAKRPNSADTVATYSFDWMWHELGVADLRR
ncbi:hypothetical protein [Hoeflea marina]|nr:hypothetical protein [Hoeflea marina]